MKISEKIKINRKKLGLTQTEFGNLLGVQKNAVSKWECGRVEDIPTSKIKMMANLFGVRPSYLVDDSEDIPSIIVSNIVPMPQTKKIPLVGQIACGKPILAEENIQRFVDCIDTIRADFCLTCVGDSMIDARICDGDVVYIKQQPEVDNGQIAAVLIDDEATLKRVYYYPEKETVILKAENKKFNDMIFTGEELTKIQILGKAVYFTSSIE